MDADVYREKIDGEVVAIIEKHLIARKMDVARARDLAKYIISALHPHMSLEQIRSVAKDFDRHFHELSLISLEITKEQEQHATNILVKQVERLLTEHKKAEANNNLQTSYDR